MTAIELNRRGAMMIGMLPALWALPATGQTAPGATGFSGRAHAIRLGGFELTTLLGGTGMSDNPIATYGLNADPAEFEALSTQNFIPADRTGGSFAPVLLRMPEALVLFDTGLKAENTLASLAMAGVAPQDVTHVVLTHMHPDHIGGLMLAGVPTFPKAQLIAQRAENDFWSARPSDAYAANVVPLLSGIRFLDGAGEVLPGITAEPAYGHTPGHTTYLLESDGQRLLITGDSFNHYVYSVQRPDWFVRFDVDKEQGAGTRKAVLARLAAERLPFAGYHMPFPALGFIADDGGGAFRYVPATYQFG